MNQSADKSPLVSIVVITYNSSEFVEETLLSIYSQDYEKIQLIISDDNSLDDTLEVCKKWVNKNRKRFVNCKILESAINTGISPNCNRGVRVASGDWVKIIAGDDALYPSLISTYVSITVKNPEIRFLHCNYDQYIGSLDEQNKIIASTKLSESSIINPKLSAEDQYQILLRVSYVKALTVMFHKSLFDEIGYFNEDYPMWEDTPMFIKITKSGVKLHYIPIIGGKYRIHEKSVLRNKKGKLFSISIVQAQKALVKLYYKDLPFWERIIKYILSYRIILLEKFNLNKNIIPVRLFNKICFSPIVIINKLIDSVYK